MTDVTNTPAVEPQPDTTLTDTINDLQAQLVAVNGKNQELLGKVSGNNKLQDQITQLGGLEHIIAQLDTKASDTTESIIAQKDKYIQELELERNTNNQNKVNQQVHDQIKVALGDHGLEGKFDLLAPHFDKHVSGELVEGQVRINIQKGGLPLLVDGRDASIGDLVEEFSKMDAFSDIFNKKVTGTGKPLKSGQVVDHNDPKDNPFTREGKNVASQLKMWQHDPKKAERLQKEADALIGR